MTHQNPRTKTISLSRWQHAPEADMLRIPDSGDTGAWSQRTAHNRGTPQRQPMETHPMRKRGFTLIELLVVIAIIALLIGILLPALGKARCSARKLVGGTNHRTIGQAFFLYAEQFDDWTPVGHDGGPGGNRWAHMWPAQLREAMGGIDSGSMEAFTNPSAPNEIPTEWKPVFNENPRGQGRAGFDAAGQFGALYGYEDGEVMIRQAISVNLIIGADEEVDGIFSLSVGLNETGTGGISARLPDDRLEDIRRNYRYFGVGHHLEHQQMLVGSGDRKIDAVNNYGVKFSTYANPADFIVTGDSNVTGDSDPVVVPGGSPFWELLPASYCGGDNANFAFADGHVENLSISDITMTEENVTRGQAGDPGAQARLRQWNNTGLPHVDTWETPPALRP